MSRAAGLPRLSWFAGLTWFAGGSGELWRRIKGL